MFRYPTFFVYINKYSVFYIFLLLHVYGNLLAIGYSSLYGLNFIYKHRVWFFIDSVLFLIFYLYYFW
jgi:hypothetical protein